MKGGPLSLLVQNREQTEEKYFAADPQSGAMRLLWTETNSAWLDLPATLPKEVPYSLPDGSGFSLDDGARRPDDA
jgi:dipeptidyl-peptidase-4